MDTQLSLFLLLLSGALVLAAILGARALRLKGHGALWRTLATLLGLAGIALAAWVGWVNYGPQLALRAGSAARPATTVPPPEAASEAPHGDPVPTAIAALEECTVAPPPAPAPDGTKASRSEMLAARSAFQQYDAATNAYLKCVDESVARVRQQFPQASPAELETLKKLGDGAHNTALDQEQAVADQLNTQVRAFKAKNPGS